MNGNVKFEDALAARLDIIKPSKTDIQNCLLAHPPKLTRGADGCYCVSRVRVWGSFNDCKQVNTL